jgi:type I restriction enzyme, S subunit
MRVELQAYPAIKPLPGSLFGSVPAGWRPIRLKFVMPHVTVGIVITPSKYYVDDGVPAIRSLNVKDGRLTDEDLVFFSVEDNQKLAKTRIYNDDVVIVRTGQTGTCAVVDERFNGANCIDLIIVRKSRHLRSRFLHYFLASGEAAAEITMNSDGAIQQHFNIGLVREIALLQPSAEEQDAIVTFLDRETAQIDRLVAVRQKQVECLREQRIAVIHHAVTRGLDPHANLKPSGIDWLPMIPETWAAHRLRRTTSRETNGFWGDDPVGDDLDIACIRVADFDRLKRRIKLGEKTLRSVPPSKRASRLLRKGDLLLEKSGGGEQTPVGCVVLYDDNGIAITSNFIAKLSPLDDHDCRFLCYLHLALYEIGITMLSVKQTTGIQNLDSFWYLNELAPFPPKAEQVQIVAHVDRETAKLDTLIAKYERELELLAEYRASLISHAVTGKIDVRGLVAAKEKELEPA